MGIWYQRAYLDSICKPIQKHKRQISKPREGELPKGLCCDWKVH